MTLRFTPRLRRDKYGHLTSQRFESMRPGRCQYRVECANEATVELDDMFMVCQDCARAETRRVMES